MAVLGESGGSAAISACEPSWTALPTTITPFLSTRASASKGALGAKALLSPPGRTGRNLCAVSLHAAHDDSCDTSSSIVKQSLSWVGLFSKGLRATSVSYLANPSIFDGLSEGGPFVVGTWIVPMVPLSAPWSIEGNPTATTWPLSLLASTGLLGVSTDPLAILLALTVFDPEWLLEGVGGKTGCARGSKIVIRPARSLTLVSVRWRLGCRRRIGAAH
mmetsp:Transcript_6644/g.20056  ORF Transcript_6644/g.20056 Transcript_6644/m.20056 type:complete len:218 (-) Transcript_6644:456-1109(-)